jgi:hypothetical protein
LHLSSRPVTAELWLEIENGDNAPISLDDASALLETSRLVFKLSTPGSVFLYYGNRGAAAPRYDLAIAGAALQSAPKAAATLGGEEVLKPSIWGTGQGTSAPVQAAFWIVLGVVIVGLLFIITRLLPTPPGSN